MTEPKTPEAMLAAVIEAQVKGGFKLWKPFKGDVLVLDTLFQAGCTTPGPHVLEILLDPVGLRAAYGTGVSERNKGKRAGLKKQRWYPVASRILDSWLTGDPEAAIRIAYELLPADC